LQELQEIAEKGLSLTNYVGILVGRVGIDKTNISAFSLHIRTVTQGSCPQNYPRIRPGNWYVVVRELSGLRTLTFGFVDAGDAGQALRQIKPRHPTARLARLSTSGD
jgi:hypothetical protein